MSRFQFLDFHPPATLDLVLRGSFFAHGRIGYRSDKILPTGLIPVLFNMGSPHRLGKSPMPDDNPSFAHSWVEGFQTTPTYNTPGDDTRVLGLLFEPPGFHALFDVDMASIRDRTVDGRDLLPRSLIDTVEREFPNAAESAAHERIFACLLTLPRKALPEWLWSFYRHIRDHRGAVALDRWYGDSGVSRRDAAAAFKRAVGVTPKRLCRIHRLLALLEAIDPSRAVSWTALAHGFGFYDQAHFNHEFRCLAGLYPTEYLRHRRKDLPELGRERACRSCQSAKPRRGPFFTSLELATFYTVTFRRKGRRVRGLFASHAVGAKPLGRGHERTRKMTGYVVVGVILQCAMVVAGHYAEAILNLSAVLGVGIPFILGIGYGRSSQTWILLTFAPASSAVAGALGAVGAFATVGTPTTPPTTDQR